MSSKKMITVTPELFNVSGKTRKKREKKELTFNPIIAPNNLKNKLLKRIKEHKTNEINRHKSVSNDNQSKSNDNQKFTNFSDEFYSAVNYLSELKNKQKQQKILYNKTVKNPVSLSSSNSNSNSNIHLPISVDNHNNMSYELDLGEPSFPTNDNIMQINYKLEDNVPYGCLKNGKKKTYRQWQEELKIQETPGLNDILVARPPTPPKRTSIESDFTSNINNVIDNSIINSNNINNTNTNDVITKEKRLENIRNKLRQIEDNENYKKDQTIKELEEIEKQMGLNDIQEIPDIDNEKNFVSLDEIFGEKTNNRENKNYIKRTVKRRFTLGKSDKLRKVAILIKNKQTRKNVINTQKELKKVSITDVKRYLRQHGIIKTGTTCPPDILRKMYESALMTGDVNNTNKENLLHNFLNQE